MSVEVKQDNSIAVESKTNDKEYNFRQLEAKRLEAEKRALEAEKRALEAERIAHEALSKRQSDSEDEDDEPYIDRKRLKKEQAKFGQQIKQETQSEIQNAVNRAIYEERKKSYLDKNPDFYTTLQNHAEKLMQKDPELAETILEMPEGFERQKLVYKNIKALGLDKPEVKQPSIQDKIDANKRSPYYQPSGVGTAPYQSVGDFSTTGQKNAYDKMKELQQRLRLG